MSTAKEFRENTLEELNGREKELRKGIQESRYKHASRQLDDTASLKQLRKQLSRLLGVKTEKSRTAGTEKK